MKSVYLLAQRCKRQAAELVETAPLAPAPQTFYHADKWLKNALTFIGEAVEICHELERESCESSVQGAIWSKAQAGLPGVIESAQSVTYQLSEVWAHLHDLPNFLLGIDADDCKAPGATEKVRAFQAEAPLLSEAERYRRAIALIESMGTTFPPEYRTLRYAIREVKS